LAHVVSSLAYPNLLGTKRLGCCWLLYGYRANHAHRFINASSVSIELENRNKRIIKM
jgi:hypothetical protein